MLLKRNIYAVGLALIFLLTLLPKEWLHECGHAVSLHHSEDAETEIKEAACDICSFSFSTYSETTPAELPCIAEVSKPVVSQPEQKAFVSYSRLSQGRAPPAHV